MHTYRERREVRITPRPAAVEADYRPWLWGRNGMARVSLVEVTYLQGTPEVRGLVSLNAYSKRSEGGASPLVLGYLSPDDARAIAAALVAAADEAER